MYNLILICVKIIINLNQRVCTGVSKKLPTVKNVFYNTEWLAFVNSTYVLVFI